MTIALRNFTSIGALVSVDNAPVDAALKSNFHRYIQGMRDIEAAKVTRQAQADEVLKLYEEVSSNAIQIWRNFASACC
jgi:hypothetical protein